MMRNACTPYTMISNRCVQKHLHEVSTANLWCCPMQQCHEIFLSFEEIRPMVAIGGILFEQCSEYGRRINGTVSLVIIQACWLRHTCVAFTNRNEGWASLSKKNPIEKVRLERQHMRLSFECVLKQLHVFVITTWTLTWTLSREAHSLRAEAVYQVKSGTGGKSG